MLPNVSSSCCGSMFKLLEITTNEKIYSMNKNNLDYDKINVFKTYNSRLQNTRVPSPIKHRTRSPSVSNNDRSS